MTSKDSECPGRIQRLDETVVNRIAAGEVIQRPSNALKELLENSLDAKSKSISIILNQGGLKLLQITDNGTGINSSDLSIVCERFTTSKLSKFDDLKSIATFGFRGEALASISHVAKLTIVTKTRDEKFGYKTSYSDGKPMGKPAPCAANQGTQIIVEDMFYNVPTRRKALKSGAEEFHRVADVVSKYAIHNSGVSFNLKKHGDQTLYVRTQKESDRKTNIGAIFGQAIAKELVEIDHKNERLKFEIKGLISNMNYNTKKFNFLLFINNRLVECSGLKRSLEMVYSAYLPKGTHPFVYLSLNIDPRNVDVNVHPTKHEVHFLHQDEITEQIQKCLDSKLLSSNSSRTFYTMPALQPVAPANVEQVVSSNNKGNESQSKKIEAKNLVRTDAKEQKIDKFVEIQTKRKENDASLEHIPNKSSTSCTSGEKSAEEFAMGARPVTKESTVSGVIENSGMDTVDASKESTMDTRNVTEESAMNTQQFSSEPNNSLLNRREIKLSSVKCLRHNVDEKCHQGMRDIIANHTYVGYVNRQFSLIQYNVKLLMVDNERLTEELFYQIMLRDFGNFHTIKLNPPPSIEELAMIALNSEDSEWTEEDGDKKEVAKEISNFLIGKSEMLDDYFSMDISSEGNLMSITQLLEGFVPNLSLLPTFIMRIVSNVEWDDEKDCFDAFCREVARFQCIRDLPGSGYDIEQHTSEHRDEEILEEILKKLLEQTVFPTAKSLFKPPEDFITSRGFIEVANLPDLYKVFERC